jgi:Winged helix-turn-helix DNA-binding
MFTRIILHDIIVVNYLSCFSLRILEKIGYTCRGREKAGKKPRFSRKESFSGNRPMGKKVKKKDPEPSPNEPGKSHRNGHHWTFLSNHAHVLAVLHSDPDMVLREVAVRVRITERAVQRIIQDLEDEGFIQRERVGRKNHYRILVHRKLRHPVESHRTIGELLKLIGEGKETSHLIEDPVN